MRPLVTSLVTTSVLLTLSAALSPLVAAEDVTTLAVGSQAPEFKLPGVDGKTYRLDNFKDAEVLVIVFTCNHCPTAQAYEERFTNFYDEYASRGVAFVAISPNDPLAVRLDELGYTDLGDSFEDMKIRARDHQYKYPYLYDGETQETSRAYGALATPHVFIFDQDRILRYNGRFDDAEVGEVTSHDAINAVEALLRGTEVPVSKTRVFGCSTKWSDKREDARRSLERWNTEEATLEIIDLQGVTEVAQNDSDDLLVVNLWATWCGPCVAEIPEFVTMHRMYRKRDFRLVTISLDKLDKQEKALETLMENHVSASNYILETDDLDAFAEALDPEWPGPIPYTLLIAPGGEVIYRKTGSIEPLKVKRAIVKVLGRTY